MSPDGSVSRAEAVSYRVLYPHDVWAEQDPATWEDALAEVVRRLVAAAGIPPAAVGALGLATQVDGVVPVGESNEPLAKAIIWLDRRATRQADALREQLEVDEVRRITGLNLDAYHVAPKIRWLIESGPPAAAAADAFLLPGSYLVARLTGLRVVDHANASSTMLYDLAARAWSPRLLDAVGLEEARLAPIAAAADVAGPLTAQAARRLGLTESCRVVVGTGDEHGAALGAGVTRPGLVCDISGTAEPVGAAATSPVVDETGLVETHGHADPRVWFVENPGFVSGGSVRWFLDVFGGDERQLNDEAATVPPGSAGVTFLPALSGATTPRWDERARGSFTGLGVGHGRPHLARALLEGCTFGLRDIVDRLEAIGLGSTEIRVVGGGARSDTWLQMKADATGRVVRVLTQPEATALGAAYLAGTAAGIFRDLDEAIACATHLEPVAYEPDARVRDAYDDAYGRYRAVFDALNPARPGAGVAA